VTGASSAPITGRSFSSVTVADVGLWRLSGCAGLFFSIFPAVCGFALIRENGVGPVLLDRCRCGAGSVCLGATAG
jgi:uncharacterized membrane protein